MNFHPSFETPADDLLIAAPHQKDGPFRAYMKKIGAGSLTLSILLHILFAVAAFFIIWATETTTKTENVDFLPGGGGGSNGAEDKKMRTKRQQVVMTKPSARITSSKEATDIVLPDPQQSTNQTSLLSSIIVGGGSKGMGSGIGGGIGNGVGIGRGNGRGPGSGVGFAAKFLGMGAVGNNIMFVIDTSSSMIANCKPEGIEAIRRELSKTVNALAPNTLFNIICFGQDADVWMPQSVMASAENKKAAVAYFDFYYRGSRTRMEKFGRAGKDDKGISFVGVKPDEVKGLEGTSGGSRMDLGLTLAFQRNASTIFLLSDGEPGTARGGQKFEKDDLIKFMAEKKDEFNKTGKVVVNTISVNKEAENFLKKIASKFNGQHKSVKIDEFK